MRHAWLITLVAVATLWSDGSGAASPTDQPLAKDAIAVIVNRSQTVGALKREDLRPIFLRIKTAWPRGGAIEAVNLPEGNNARAAFDLAVLEMDPEECARYWVDRRIRGDAPPPRKVGSSAVVVALVAKSEGTIGYVPYTDIDASVRVVARISQGQVLSP